MLHVSQVLWCYENLEFCLGCHVLKENTVSDFLDAMFFLRVNLNELRRFYSLL